MPSRSRPAAAVRPVALLTLLWSAGFVLLPHRARGLVDAVLVVIGFLWLAARHRSTVRDNAALTSVLETRERHFRSMLHGVRDVIVLCGTDLRATYVSPSSLDVLGVPPEEIVGLRLLELVHPDDRESALRTFEELLSGQGEGPSARLRCRIAAAGGWVDTESTVGDLRHDPSVAGIVITTRDVSERAALEHQLRRLARQDPLTGLANRLVLRDRLEHVLEQRAAVRTPVALLLIDLDGFKTVNDSAGHEAGDVLLVEVAKRLSAAVRHGDTVARLGGDEFAILLEDRDDGDVGAAAHRVAERLLDSLSQPVLARGRAIAIGASMGLAVSRLGSTTEALLREADLALYASKSSGRGRATAFGPELEAEAVRRADLTADLRLALRDGLLQLGYQPVVDLARCHVVGVEALARWDHPVWGYVPPSEFVPLAEATGLIDALGAWALSTAVEQAQAWHDAGHPLDVAVNVSVRQLGPAFVERVAQALRGTTFGARRITLEITESVLVDDERTLTSLRRLKELGVRLAVDDFGTGWSSLGYLRRLPVDVLKLDRSFVRDLGSRDADALSRTVVQMAEDLGLDVVAEGVETSSQRDALRGMGCAFAQGWLFGRAVPAARVPIECQRLAATAAASLLPPPRPEPWPDEATVSAYGTIISGS